MLSTALVPNASFQVVLDAEMQPAESAQQFWPALQKVAKRFGSEHVTRYGNLDRRKIAVAGVDFQ
jgi:hypothetical protein